MKKEVKPAVPSSWTHLNGPESDGNDLRSGGSVGGEGASGVPL